MTFLRESISTQWNILHKQAVRGDSNVSKYTMNLTRTTIKYLHNFVIVFYA